MFTAESAEVPSVLVAETLTRIGSPMVLEVDVKSVEIESPLHC